MERRNFIRQSSLLMTGIGLVNPFNIIIAKEKTGPIIGHGDFKYRVNNTWGI
jgi:hypothetical protein